MSYIPGMKVGLTFQNQYNSVYVTYRFNMTLNPLVYGKEKEVALL